MATYVLVHSPVTGPVAWLAVADALARRGIDSLVCDLHDHGPPYWMQHAASVGDAVRREVPAGPVIVVAHSGAGALLPAIRRGIDSREVAGYVFVDSGIPADGRTRLEAFAAEAPQAARALAEHLDAGGEFPQWSDQDLSTVVPDGDRRSALVRSLRPRGLDYWSEPIPVFPGWPDAPCGYVLLSESYEPHAAFARDQGWPLVRFDGTGHFHGLVDPDAVAAAIVRVSPGV